MVEVDAVLTIVIQIAFAALAIGTAASFVHQPDRRHGFLVVAIGSLAVLFMLSPGFYGGGLSGRLATDATIVLFLLSGFGLVMFRDAFVPYSRLGRRSVLAAIVIAGALGIGAQLPAPPDTRYSTLQSVSVVVLVCVWAYCILEPAVSFWIAADRRPAVEKARLRAISAGYACLFVVVVVGIVGGSLNAAWSVLVDVLALAVVPVLFISFFPPTWLRRIWRQPEEDQFRLALHDLLLYSPDRTTLAARALGWAERLVGGDAAFVVDSDGSILAAHGVVVDAASAKAARDEVVKPERDGNPAPWRDGATLFVPLDLDGGRGAMVIVARGLSPIFGDEELSRLRQYAASITAGLDRVALNSRIASLERAKSDFLSIASHELRGPMTVIKGYLTMLESGSLGDVSPKIHSVLPLLISKSDEVNWMIEQMIEASRLEEGKLALKKQKLDMVELTDLAIDGVRMLIGSHNLSLSEPSEPIETDLDPDRFQIVIRNLISNAAKYSPGESDIEVRITRDGTKGFVAVTDHGSGISNEDQRQLFTRFGRIANAAHVQGTGLGLWLSREIARMHDGDLTVQSEVGRGSTFTLELPITR